NTEPLLESAPFTRRVTELLMRSLARLAIALEADEFGPVLNPGPDELVISANLCEGLVEMSPRGEEASLTISASWARSLPPPATLSIPRQVQLRQEFFPRLQDLATRLRPAVASRRQVLVGFVDTLDGRPNLEGQREGPVVLRLVLPEGELILARVELN